MPCVRSSRVKISLMPNWMRRRLRISSSIFKKFSRRNLETEESRKPTMWTRQASTCSRERAMTRTTSLLTRRRTCWSSRDAERPWPSRMSLSLISLTHQSTKSSTLESQTKQFQTSMKLFKLTKSYDPFPCLPSYTENRNSLTLNDNQTMTILIWTSQILISLHLWEFENWLKGRVSISQSCWWSKMWRLSLRTS